MVLIPSHSSRSHSHSRLPSWSHRAGARPSCWLKSRGTENPWRGPLFIRRMYNPSLSLNRAHKILLGCSRMCTSHCWCWCVLVALCRSGQFVVSWVISSDEFSRTTSLQSLWALGRLSYTTSQHVFFLSLTCYFLVIISLFTPYTCRAQLHKFTKRFLWHKALISHT